MRWILSIRIQPVTVSMKTQKLYHIYGLADFYGGILWYMYQLTKDEKYLKRFAWLPRIKGKRINNLNDLLSYIEFEDDNQKLFYQILIRNFDTFIHPSFNFSLNIESKKSDYRQGYRKIPSRMPYKQYT